MANNDKYNRNDGKGKGGKFQFLDTSKAGITAIKYKEDGDYALDIMPFKIGTKHHPDVAEGRADIGDEDYMLQLYVHYGVGPSKTNVICPESFGKTCPLCNHVKEVQQQYGRNSPEGDAAYKKFGRSSKAFFYVVDPDSKDKQIQLFETSVKNFQKEMWEEAQHQGKKIGISYIPFADFPKGHTVEFRVTMEKNGGVTQPFPKFKSFAFKARTGKEYPADFLDDLPGLDELMILRTAQEIEALMSGGDDDDEDADTTTSPRSRSARTEEVEEEAQVRSRGRTEEKEEEPEEKASPKCPAKGGTFGKDVDDLDECNDCTLRSACSAEYRTNRRRGA